VHLKETPIFHDSQFLIPLSAIERPLDQVFYSSYKLPVREQTHIIDTIVIDPGHGGKDPGAIGITGLREKDVNLDISKLLKRRLQAEGINVILTRSCDKFLSLWQRAHIANEEKADFFISIHANASRSRQASGFEVYYLSEACDDSARAVQASENAALDFETDFKIKTSDQLKATLWDIIYTENRVESIELAQSLVNSMDNAKISRNRGVKSALFYVLKGTRIPSVLIEVGFISNRYEETKLKKSSYRQEIADCIAEGILNYKKRYELTDGFTN
jgi:N-acetylmuramoyl-L-alanine amidase